MVVIPKSRASGDIGKQNSAYRAAKRKSAPKKALFRLVRNGHGVHGMLSPFQP